MYDVKYIKNKIKIDKKYEIKCSYLNLYVQQVIDRNPILVKKT